MPEQLGKYVLEKRIGAGGMADVFLARGPSGTCVVKRPHPHLCNSPEFVKMFLDEASLVAQLTHPGIATVFDLGQVNGVYYLAMEYVPGYDLMTISLEHERHGEYMAPELAARVMADAALALHYAHDALGARGQPLNIIHRDVTPHNILLSTTGHVKVIDFGVAKAADTMHRTQAGLVKGKYPYMAPEQITGQKIDRRVDVYALGLVLYELLTNARAIAGEMEVEQIENARHMRIKPVEQLRPNTPEPLKIILNSCFQMNPEKRYPSAAALAADLEKYLVYEGHKVGREDLLRLFRVIAAEQGKPADVVPAQPLDKTYHGAGSGSAPVGPLATDAAAAKTDLEVPSNPLVPKLPPQVAVLKLGEAQAVEPLQLLAPTDQNVPVPKAGVTPSSGVTAPEPAYVPAAPAPPASMPELVVPPPSRPPFALIAVGLVLLGVVGFLGWKVVGGSETTGEPPKDP
ncbi:MAG: serine/threonine protein kinase, partial [Myxococcaceae bacterium]|nr:serine/threonine protein kinase [Myxococcaceae bacterium]